MFYREKIPRTTIYKVLNITPSRVYNTVRRFALYRRISFEKRLPPESRIKVRIGHINYLKMLLRDPQTADWTIKKKRDALLKKFPEIQSLSASHVHYIYKRVIGASYKKLVYFHSDANSYSNKKIRRNVLLNF